MNPNERQVQGDHYKSGYQHWDLVLETDMGYLEGCATKYIARWRKKGGVADLEKAQHYVEKLKSDVQVRPLKPEGTKRFIDDQVSLFNDINDLDMLEAYLINILANWETITELRQVINDLAYLIDQNTFDTGEPGAGYVDQG